MSHELVDHTEEYRVTTPRQNICKIYLTHQFDRHWVASVIYSDDKELKRIAHPDTRREGAYIKAIQWVINNIDDQAVIEPLI